LSPDTKVLVRISFMFANNSIFVGFSIIVEGALRTIYFLLLIRGIASTTILWEKFFLMTLAINDVQINLSHGYDNNNIQYLQNTE